VRSRARMFLAMTVLGTSIAFTFMSAGPASACTGDPCDGFCAVYNQLPPAVQKQLVGPDGC
jgi:hypothetical protein